MRDILPDLVFMNISDHIRSGVARAEKGWEAARDEEDSLTGALGLSLQTHDWLPTLDEPNDMEISLAENDDVDHGETLPLVPLEEGEEDDLTTRLGRFLDSRWSNYESITQRMWRWRIDYKKFRGRGKGAIEKEIGADGLFQIELQNMVTGEMTMKGLLFQSKKEWQVKNTDLLKQAEKMERFVAGGGAVFDYEPDGYRAADATEVIKAEGTPHNLGNVGIMNLADYLTTRFMECKVGKRGLYYDAVRHVLVIPNDAKGVDIRKYSIRHRFTIEVQRF
jgi:hypothetical protein